MKYDIITRRRLFAGAGVYFVPGSDVGPGHPLRLTRLFFGFAAIVFLMSAAPSTAAWRFLRLPSARALRHHMETPDTARMRLAVSGGRLSAVLGQAFLPVVMRYPPFQFGVVISPFMELHNFSPDQITPWELWRGYIGGGVYVDWTPAAARVLSLMMGYSHESDHATDIAAYKRLFTTLSTEEWFDNKSLRSFEYTAFGAAWSEEICQCWRMGGAALFKWYPQPLNRWSTRLLHWGTQLTWSTTLVLPANFSLILTYYLEYTAADFSAVDPIFTADLSGNRLFAQQAKLGVFYNSSEGRQIGVSVTGRGGNGRGLEFCRELTVIGCQLEFRP